MSANHKRIVVWAVIGLLIVAGVIYAFVPRALTVDLITVEPGPMIVTVDEEAETRIHDVFVMSAPVAGHMRRIEIHVGDEVVANETVLAQIEPSDSQFLDPRSEAQARAAVQAAESARALARARIEEAAAEHEYAIAERRRAKELIVDGTISERDADAAERAYKMSRASLATAQAALQMSEFELQQAQAQLLSPAETQVDREDCACVTVTAPVSGQVLRIVNPSERVVASDALVEIGNAQDLEIVADYLSTDAVLIEVGQSVIVDNWGGSVPLEGVVRRVEPFGFKKISALGIEEQRVNVIIDFKSPVEALAKLGHGYQVESRVVLWEEASALFVPLTALFREQDSWALFVVENGRAALRQVEIGRRNNLNAQVVSGLANGDRVILHPSDRILHGVRVTPRS
jgi:HlyD family secretion protein